MRWRDAHSLARVYGALLSGYVRPQLGAAGALAALLAGSTALQLAGPQVMRAFIDGATTGASPGHLRNIGALFIGLALLQQALAVLATYRHPTSGRGIEHASVSLRRGTLTVVTGRVGAGKTTLLQSLLGLFSAESGRILRNGVPIDDPASFFVPPRSAYTPQVPRLFSESLRDNILLGLDPATADLDAALRLAALERDVASMDQGLDSRVGPKGVRLSGGQIQRAAAARMFVRQPALLVFDDLSSALDVETERTLWERILPPSPNGHRGR